MVMLATNIAHSSTDPRITVDNKLEPGQHRLRLVVVDEAGNASLPSDIVITVGAKRVIPVNPEIFVRPDIFVRPEIFTAPVTPPVSPPVTSPVRPIGTVINTTINPTISPTVNPTIFSPIRPRKPII